jgi:hypothetical protein
VQGLLDVAPTWTLAALLGFFKIQRSRAVVRERIEIHVSELIGRF